MDTPNTIRRKRAHSVTPPQKTDISDPNTKGFTYKSPSDKKDPKRRMNLNEKTTPVSIEDVKTPQNQPTVADSDPAPPKGRRTRSMTRRPPTSALLRSKSLDSRLPTSQKKKEENDILSIILLNMQNKLKSTTNTIVEKIDAKIDGLKVDF